MNTKLAPLLVASISFWTACSSEPPTGSPDGGRPSSDLAATLPSDAGSDEDLAGSGEVVSFVAIGDTGKGSVEQTQVATAIQQKCAQAGCDFVQLLGDNIYDSGVTSTADPQWQEKFEVPYASINLPFYVVLGNHDYGGGGTGNEFGKGQFEIDYSNVSTKWKLPSAYWHRTEKHVEFFGMDTNMQMYGMAAQQKLDVAAWLAASTATWKIALGHHPYLSNGKHGNAGNYDGLSFIPIANGKNVKDFMEAAVCGKADLLLSGHDHSRQWLMDTCSGTEMIVSGAGASVTTLPGSNAVHFQADTIGFVYIKIAGRSLTAEFIDANGTVEFTRTLTK